MLVNFGSIDQVDSPVHCCCSYHYCSGLTLVSDYRRWRTTNFEVANDDWLFNLECSFYPLSYSMPLSFIAQHLKFATVVDDRLFRNPLPHRKLAFALCF